MKKIAAWRESVRVVRAESMSEAMAETGRATAFDFVGTGGKKTWIGGVTLVGGACTGAHHHGRHEVVIFVTKGRTEIRWGERLEFAAQAGVGDFVYFAPYVPHQELNLNAIESVGFVVVRSDNQKLVFKLDVDPVERPEKVY
ncbi:MAG TPA: mannose-6-phosphate isomerase [Burkholderiales bacterium]|nr:mannose-6-phosphate isomerase [Burkholderiales bacterium]